MLYNDENIVLLVDFIYNHQLKYSKLLSTPKYREILEKDLMVFILGRGYCNETSN